MPDKLHVNCSTYREALSARLDGEAGPVTDEELDEHLVACAPCCSWQHRAAEMSRGLRVRPVMATPDFTETALQHASRRLAPGPRRWPRVLLAVVAACQIALAATEVVLGGTAHEHRDPAAMAGHLFNESTSYNLAMGVGMLWAAWRVRASAGLLPVLTVFLAVLTAYCCYDLATGQVPVERVLSHGILAVGLALLVAVHRDQQRWHPHPGSGQQAGTSAVAITEAPAHPPAARRTGRRRPGLSGSHRAA